MKQVRFVIKKSLNKAVAPEINAGIIWSNVLDRKQGDYFKDVFKSIYLNTQPSIVEWAATAPEATLFEEYANAEKLIDELINIEGYKYLYQIKKIYLPI